MDLMQEPFSHNRIYLQRGGDFLFVIIIFF